MNLEHLKVGDKVVFVHYAGWDQKWDHHPWEITRVGNLFVEAKGKDGEPKKFRLRDGTSWGSGDYSHSSFLRKYDAKEFNRVIAEQRENNAISRISGWLNDIRWKDQPLKLLNEIRRVIWKHDPSLVGGKKDEETQELAR